MNTKEKIEVALSISFFVFYVWLVLSEKPAVEEGFWYRYKWLKEQRRRQAAQEAEVQRMAFELAYETEQYLATT